VYCDGAAWNLARRAVLGLLHGQGRSRWLPDTPAIFSRLLFQQRESLRDRCVYVWHTTTTPDLFHLRRMPLPKPAYPLYRLLVPLHDFVLYPLVQLLKRARSAEPVRR
jgi:hypothetical protein